MGKYLSLNTYCLLLTCRCEQVFCVLWSSWNLLAICCGTHWVPLMNEPLLGWQASSMPVQPYQCPLHKPQSVVHVVCVKRWLARTDDLEIVLNLAVFPATHTFIQSKYKSKDLHSKAFHYFLKFPCVKTKGLLVVSLKKRTDVQKISIDITCPSNVLISQVVYTLKPQIGQLSYNPKQDTVARILETGLTCTMVYIFWNDITLDLLNGIKPRLLCLQADNIVDFS